MTPTALTGGRRTWRMGYAALFRYLHQYTYWVREEDYAFDLMTMGGSTLETCLYKSLSVYMAQHLFLMSAFSTLKWTTHVFRRQGWEAGYQSANIKQKNFS